MSVNRENEKCTLPDPTGPITQIKSPGWASNTIFFNENVPFYNTNNIISNPMKIRIFTFSHCACFKLHITSGVLFIGFWSILSIAEISLHDVDNNRWSLSDSSSKRNPYRQFPCQFDTKKAMQITNSNSFLSCHIIKQITNSVIKIIHTRLLCITEYYIWDSE